MWKKHHSVFEYHFQYVQNDIIKFYIVRILKYSGFIQQMFDLFLLLFLFSIRSSNFMVILIEDRQAFQWRGCQTFYQG